MERDGIPGDHGMGVRRGYKRCIQMGEDIWIYHKKTRVRNGLSKRHIVDARCLSGDPWAKPCWETFTRKAVRRHNRQILQGGVCRLNQAPKSIQGFQLFDKVLCAGEEGFLFGCRTSGYFDVQKLDETKNSYRKW